VVDKVKRRPLNDAEIWRLAQSKTNKPLPFGTCCSQVMGSFFELQYISPGQLISSSDCGFGLQGCNRDIACFKTVAIAQHANIVRRAIGLPECFGRTSETALQTDFVPKTSRI
jgi:hypothetical protein